MNAVEFKHELKVIGKKQETNDAYTFELQVPEDKKQLFHYKPGQFITFFMKINNEEIARSYSFCSSPMADENLKVTVKRVPAGKGSNYLINEISVGDSLWSSPPAGHFFNMSQTIEDELEYVLFAAGSGVTPMMSILKWSLPNLPKHKIHLVYSNKNPSSTIFLDELDELKNQYENFKVTHFFSQHDEKSEKLRDAELSSILAHTFESDTQKSFYLCGPHPYMEMIETQLKQRDVREEWIHKESFFAPEPTANTTKVAESNNIYINFIPDHVDQQDCTKIEAEIDGSYVTVDGNSDESILEVILEAGETPPFSCMSGSCQACMCELIEGKVYQESEGILTEDDLKQKRFLSCQAKAISENIKIKFVE